MDLKGLSVKIGRNSVQVTFEALRYETNGTNGFTHCILYKNIAVKRLY